MLRMINDCLSPFNSKMELTMIASVIMVHLPLSLFQDISCKPESNPHHTRFYETLSASSQHKSRVVATCTSTLKSAHLRHTIFLFKPLK
jgi:hypothetical protein